MDTIPHSELMKIFRRVAEVVDLKDCETPEDVRQEVLRTLRIMQSAVDNAKRPSTKWKWLGNMKFLWTIIREGTQPKAIVTQKRKYDLDVPNKRVGFQTAVIREAIENPDGLINLTFDYGYPRAIKKLEKRKQVNLLNIHKHRKPKSQRKW
jgi:hypothetical protein